MTRSYRCMTSVALLLAIVGCNESESYRVVGSGNVITQRPAVELFDTVELIGGFRVDLTVGEAPSLAITTDDNIMPLIETSVSDGTLTVALREKVKPSDANVLVISAMSLSALDCKGAAKATVNGAAGDSLRVGVQGAASVKLAGATDKLLVHVNGAGTIAALELMAKDVEVRVEGAGDVDIHATDSLDVTLEGLGAVRYRGEPKVTKSIRGLGTVRKY